jgi:hypothetical protein
VVPPPVQVVDDVLTRVADLLPADVQLGDVDLTYPLDQIEIDLGAPVNASPGGFEPLERSISVRVHERAWDVLLRLVAEESVSDWLRVQRVDSADNRSTVTVTVNQAHPFMRNFAELPGQDLEPVWRLAVALGLGVQLARDGGDQAALVLMKVNGLLRNYLAVQA